jgi:hypothetical protein
MLGPVFRWELVRTSRRNSRWILRTGYVAALIGLLGIHWTGHDLATVSEQTATAHAIRNCLTGFHAAFSICQLVAAVLLGPIFAAGSLVEERTGRTLMLVLGSRVSPLEFVTAKIGAALSRLGDVFLCGVPFSAICVLFAAVRPETVVAELLLAISTAFATTALALLIAVGCRRLVDSLIFTYFVQGLWFSLPAIHIITLALGPWPIVPDTLLRLNALRATADLGLDAAGPWWAAWSAPAAAMVGIGVAFWLAAVVFVRPASHWIESRDVERLKVTSWSWRWSRAVAVASRPVWDRPVLWRELRCRRASWVERLVWFVFIAAGLGVLTLIVREWPSSVLAVANPTASGPPPLVCIISSVATFCHLAFLAFPFLAVAGATGFADEREGRMLELIRLTDLRHAELVNAKVVRLARLVLILLLPPLVLTGVMVAIGYSTWMSSLLVTTNCLASFAFAALLGLAIGVRSRKTSHAVATTIVFGLVGGILIPVLSMLSVRGGPTPAQYAFVTVSPPIQCYFLMFHDTAGVMTPLPEISVVVMRVVAASWTAAFGLASLGLYFSALRAATRDISREC